MNTDDEIIEMLPGDLGGIARAAGIEAAVRIAKTFRGSFLYVPGLDEMMRVARDAIIRKEYAGGTRARKLARKYRLTERQIWNIIKNPSGASLPDWILEIIEEEEKTG